jgi:hypothetical protein
MLAAFGRSTYRTALPPGNPLTCPARRNIALALSGRSGNAPLASQAPGER